MIPFVLIIIVPFCASFGSYTYNVHTSSEEFFNKSSGLTVTPYICGNILRTDRETTCESSTFIDVASCRSNPMKILLTDYPFYLRHREFLLRKGRSEFLKHVDGAMIMGDPKPFNEGIFSGRALKTALRIPGVPIRDFIYENITVFEDGIVFQSYTDLCFSDYRCLKDNLYPGNLQLTHIYHTENQTIESSFEINLNITMEWPRKNSGDDLKKFSQQYIDAFEAVISEYCSRDSSLMNGKIYMLTRQRGFSWTLTIDKTTGFILVSALLAVSLLVNVLCYCNSGLFHTKNQWVSLKSETSA